MKTTAAALILALAVGGCAAAPDHSEYFGDPPTPEQKLEQTLTASEKGPSQWHPALTIPLSPVLLVADTAIKFVGATYRWIRDLFGGSEEGPAVPERIEKQAEKIPKN